MERLIQNIPSDWKIVELGKVGEVVNGLTYSPDDVDETGVLVLRSSNIQNGNLSFKDNVFVKVNESNFNAVQSNDILICVRNGSRNLIGKNTIIPKGVEGLAFGAFMTVYRSKFNPFFIHVFNTEIYYHQINQNLGATINSINNSDLKKFKVPFPPLPEQQKIAAILSKWDELIDTQTQLINTKERQKTSLMQKLLTGEVRFPGFNDEWKTVELGKVGQVINGLTYSPDDIHEEGVLVLRSSNVQKRRLAFKDNVYVNVDDGKFNPVQENDILICVRNGSQDLIGKNAIIDKANEGLAFGAFMTIYRSEYNPFFFHLFDTPFYNKEVYKNLGATINSINGSDLKKFKMPFPGVEEQKKITSLLDSMDKEVASLSEELESLKLQKKGLMQQLLTGKIRVKI